MLMKSTIENKLRLKHSTMIYFSILQTTLASIREHEEIEAQTPRHPISKTLKPDAPIFIPSTKKLRQRKSVYIKKHKFVPKYKPRAHLNIYIGKPVTKQLLTIINEDFNDSSKLYYYLDGTTALQIIQEQMHIFQKSKNETLTIMNLDLHKKSTNETLYGVVVPNDAEKIKKCNQETSDKWLWKLAECMTANEIKSKYQINELPKSTRFGSNGLYSQIKQQRNKFNISDNILLNMKWRNIRNIQQIGASAKFKKNGHKNRMCHLNRFYWNKCVRNSWYQFDAVPIVVYNSSENNNEYGVEWVKFIYIESMKSYIGVSFKYNSNANDNNLWNLQAIYLDKGDMYNKHRLCGLTTQSNHMLYANTSITQITWL